MTFSYADRPGRKAAALNATSRHREEKQNRGGSYSVNRSSVRSKVSLQKSPRMQSSSSKAALARDHQPQQVERIFKALQKGLNEYLEAHQMELDFLASQQKDTRRNSRLAFLYDLEKQTRAAERYIRRLEFHISKIEELYESYCIHWRLCDGAQNMKKAFSMLPSSKASRESLLELSKNYKECMEDMCLIEGALEILLGELHVSMKGLIGFARLCPGDQYEVLIRLGRQRWKLRGKIQTDNRQTWDTERMIFLPHIHENFEIKVTELRGLSTILVGEVTCESVDFFSVRNQIMVVDITELGTIKLQLELVWNPFDFGETDLLSSSASRLSISSRKGSLYSWTPPSTPSFREKYFISVVQQIHDPDGSFPLTPRDTRGISILDYLADSPHGSLSPIFLKHRKNFQTSSQTVFSPSSRDEPQANGTGRQTRLSSGGWSEDSLSKEESHSDNLLPQQWYGTPDILKENGLKADGYPSSGQISTKQLKLEEGTDKGKDSRDTQDKSHLGKSRHSISGLLQDVFEALKSLQKEDRTLKRLEKQTLYFRDILKSTLYVHQTSSTETLAVEEVLESFDFLASDFNADEMSCHGSVRVRDPRSGNLQAGTLRSLQFGSKDSKSAPSNTESVSLTTGNESLDVALVCHLWVCKVLLQHLKSSESKLVQDVLLEELSLQADVLQKISRLSMDTTKNGYFAKEVVPKSQHLKPLLALWDECAASTAVFHCSTERLLKQLKKHFIHKVKAKEPGQADKVFKTLLEQMLTCCRRVPSATYSEGVISIFQFFSYLNESSGVDFGEHLAQLSREVQLLEALGSPKRRKALKKLKGKRMTQLQPLAHTLKLLAALQVDGNHKVAKAAHSCLARGSRIRTFKVKASVFYTEVLKDKDMRVQLAACWALKHLKAVDSLDQIVTLWHSEDEELRGAARETVLSFGKKGQVAFLRMDKICCELQEEPFRNADTEITIL
ncbi:RIPOR family member 3 isoform X2 [Erpetoichthys calabaricus]|uniref:RIPOR family member 3 isoform X2 n=1 Tax=Erpetoichthys calabaricus TaxID=27687 RepID=UPI002234B2C5|nr:RIPOR family member 3 isoform X2 [Erpetoichthys calabaricus]